jgi:hypothetical protein
MKRRINWLGVLRRRGCSLGRLVLALFALATIATTGAPCFAMTVEAQSAAMRHEDMHASAATVAHDHSHMGHAVSGKSASASHGESPASNHCPHCPLAASMPGHAATGDGSHGVCSAVGAASEHAELGVAALAFKHLTAAPQFEPPASAVLRPPGIAFAFVSPALAYRSVPLNLRHCVFLI